MATFTQLLEEWFAACTKADQRRRAVLRHAGGPNEQTWRKAYEESVRQREALAKRLNDMVGEERSDG